MKKNSKNENPTYMQNLVHMLYREYCNAVDILGESSEIPTALYMALRECMEYCDKNDINYSLNYD